MKRFVSMAVGVGSVLTLAACSDNPTSPEFSKGPSALSADVVIACDPSIDPGCNPGGSPIEQLVNALTADINQLNLPPGLKPRLLASINEIPTELAGLSAAEKLEAIRRTQTLIRLVEALSPRFIPVTNANEMVGLLNLLAVAFSV